MENLPPLPPPRLRRLVTGLHDVPVYIIDSNNNITRINRVLRTGDYNYWLMIPDIGDPSPRFYLFYDIQNNTARWYQIGDDAQILVAPHNITEINPNQLVPVNDVNYNEIINGDLLINPEIVNPDPDINVQLKYLKYKQKYINLKKKIS